MAKGKAAKKNEATVVRVSAKDDGKKKTKKIEEAVVAAPAVAPVEKKREKGVNPIIAIGGYFKGAWQELKQVRWPNRQATWSMTAALLGFTAFFVVLILLLDALFKYVFQLILG
ncbi:MAG TPA: preprotein translocase subunit SecE [Candidatus Saccharimonadales bacterium]|nr:preprotein translocase subunit SecE [Candidatus Saccharimonadales bacterium]